LKLEHFTLMSALVVSALMLSVGALAREVDVAKHVDQRFERYSTLAKDIWDYAELGYLEEKSSKRLQQELKREGFKVKTRVAEIPTAFVASFGRGRPVIGILAEFDALPGLSQDAVPNRSPLVADGPGHACGHHLFGSASVAGAIAVKGWLEAGGHEGTVRLYGTPAEEGGSGKVYITRAGAFDDVDIVIHWHPSDRNRVNYRTSTANKSGRFQFHGLAAHAAAAPDRGRSALDGVEAMNYMVNMMREHVPSDARIHYVITDGGDAPNIVPEFAEVYYYVRHTDIEVAKALFERVVKAAEGAARGTGTTMDYEVMHGNYPVLPNETLARLVDAKLHQLGGFEYTRDETEFARKIRETLIGVRLELGSHREIQPMEFRRGMGSTDVGDVSWMVPTIGLGTATWVPGTPAHSWQAVAAGGMSIGFKGMALAAKAIALTAVDLFEQPEIIEAAREEFEKRRGADFEYRALLGDRDPPLDYRL
jgi:aminobenzoyl-glutamate utilization protein B